MIADAEQAHRIFATDVKRDALRNGYGKLLNNWQKRQRRVTVSFEGKILSKPRVVGTKTVTSTGTQVDSQALFDFMTWEQIEAKVGEYAKQVKAFRSNIALAVKLLELHELAPDSATPDQAARTLGTTLDAWLGEDAA